MIDGGGPADLREVSVELRMDILPRGPSAESATTANSAELIRDDSHSRISRSSPSGAATRAH